MRRTVEVDGVQHTVMAHDPAREEYFVSASDNAQTGAFYLCTIRTGRRACTCKAGQNGFRRLPNGACRHVRAALQASVLEAAEDLQRRGQVVGFGPSNLPDPFV